ncbi:MAG: DUF2027 domain-containing protein [Bacteroidales bacterium]|nr:DUF2027 domain-containing protein [Bacteroidales bacterium]
MTINIGDKVRFLNDVGGGVVVQIISKSQVMVKDNDDFEYPFPINELVVVEKSAQIVKENSSKPNIETSSTIINSIGKSEKPELKNDNITELVFAFINKSEIDDSQFECYLINDSDYYIFYHVVIRGENAYEKIDAEVIEPNTKILLGNIDREQINSSKELIVQMLFYNHPYQTLHELVERKIKIVPLKFFQSHNFVENAYFDEKAYLFVLLKEVQGLGNSIKNDDDFERYIAEKESPEEDLSKRFKQRKDAVTIEVDLHINQLVDSVIGMSNAEIIQKQMDVFHKTMTEAIATKAAKVILIHGIGNGTLKEKLRESITQQYKLAFEDASFREYGFGATMVIL